MAPYSPALIDPHVIKLITDYLQVITHSCLALIIIKIAFSWAIKNVFIIYIINYYLYTSRFYKSDNRLITVTLTTKLIPSV